MDVKKNKETEELQLKFDQQDIQDRASCEGEVTHLRQRSITYAVLGGLGVGLWFVLSIMMPSSVFIKWQLPMLLAVASVIYPIVNEFKVVDLRNQTVSKIDRRRRAG